MCPPPFLHMAALKLNFVILALSVLYCYYFLVNNTFSFFLLVLFSLLNLRFCISLTNDSICLSIINKVKTVFYCLNGKIFASVFFTFHFHNYFCHDRETWQTLKFFRILCFDTSKTFATFCFSLFFLLNYGELNQKTFHVVAGMLIVYLLKAQQNYCQLKYTIQVTNMI